MYEQLILLNDESASRMSMEIFSKLAGNPNVIYKTTYEWNMTPGLKSKKGFVYVYTDHQFLDGKEIPGIKLGNGTSYVIELPFLDDIYARHLLDDERHITQAERDFWNNKERCYGDGSNETLIFTKH